MEINISTNFDLSKFDTDRMIQIGLHNSITELQRIAAKNAPYQTWKLSQGIGIEEGNKTARVGPRKINYAVVREYINKKNPHKRFYMRKTHDVSGKVVENAFITAYNIVIKKIWRS